MMGIMPSHPALLGAPVRLSGITAAHGLRAALTDVDLVIPPASVTVIAGPNGAGKSTLLEVIAGTHVPASGLREVTASVALVPQRSAIPERLPVSVRDVVAVGTWGRLGLWRRMDRDARRLVDRSLERVRVSELQRRPFSALSGGQKQRTLLAQGIAREPDLLLLDEPTTGLDAASGQRIRRVMREEAECGAAVVCVSHDEDVIAEADLVVRLEAGRVASVV